MNARNSAELPPIINALSPVPQVSSTKDVPELYQTITSQIRNAKEHELDSIINQTLSNFKNQKINKIIFTTPMTNRIGKTIHQPDKKRIGISPRTMERQHDYVTINARGLMGRMNRLEHPYSVGLSFDFDGDFGIDFSRYEN